MRNLFGWSSPPKRKDRKYSRLRAAALQELIAAKAANQIFVDIEEHGDGYVVPLSILNFLAEGDGTILKNTEIRKKTATETAGDPTVTVPTGERWDVLQMIGSYNCDVNAADRAVRFAIYATTSTTIAGATITYLGTVITLTSDQDGQLYTGRSRMLYRNDNGATGATTNEDICPVFLDAGSTIVLNATNNQAGDVASLDVYYKLVSTYAD